MRKATALLSIGALYRHPKPRCTYGAPPPRVLATTIARYCREFEARHGPLWDYFASRVPALYDEQGAVLDRQRGLRSDGADSLLCVIVALLKSMDVRRGFLGRPPLQEGGRWHRRGVRELFGFAFGKPVHGALSIRRIERWLRALTALKVLTTHQLRVKSLRGFESLTAVRHVTDQLFRLAGTYGQLAQERRKAFQAAERERAQRSVESVRIGPKLPAAPSAAVASSSAIKPATPPARAGPESIRALLRAVIAPNRR